MHKKIILSLILVSSIFLQGCNDKSDDSSANAANSMVAGNEYVLTDTDLKQIVVKKQGDGYLVEGAENKIVIFDIFATWCPPCQESAATISALQAKYKDKIVVVGLTIEDKISNDDLVKFKTTYKANYSLANSDQNRRLIDELAKSLELGERFPIPVMAIYKDAKLINHYLGAVEEEFVESDIKKALEI
ncbi:MAG: TlpA disulfide reductase family protein [Sulfurimonas sp.]|nr:TlpA disulfide reductase family protein [Sulfurimonas sp.]